MQRLLVVFALSLSSVITYANTYYKCGSSVKYHLNLDCEGLKNCTSGIVELQGSQASRLELCRWCQESSDDDITSVRHTYESNNSHPRTKSSQSKSPHFYWLRYLLLGIAAGLFKVGKRWEVVGAVIGVAIFAYWMNQYFGARTFKLSYCVTQSTLFALGFGLSQTLITQIYKNRKSDSLISAMMDALKNSEAELLESKKKNDTLEQQITKLNLTKLQTEEALKRSHQIIAQLKTINPDTNSSKIVPVKNEKHRDYLIDALRNAEKRIVITSGWIRNSVITNEFKSLFKACLDRNVKVFIYYGYVYGNKHEKSDKEALEFLEHMSEQYSNFVFRNHLTNDQSGISGNHSKILILDKRFVVLGSFNWLSNSGRYRKNLEMSLATNDSRTILEVISKLRSN